ncbi:hypothetical protein ABN242_03050 [Providencia alcalifaciens]|uniref:hypothetical protein n=1 Tax=Providencia alcalifaciens TaxID=126385 RepID=UPI0032DBD3D7
MKERGIIFNTEMVRAILDGRKTQTRSVVKGATSNHIFHGWVTSSIHSKDEGRACWSNNTLSMRGNSIRLHCPLGKIGDRLWVRETWQGPLVDSEKAYDLFKDPTPYQKVENCVYKADGGYAPEYIDCDDNFRQGWRPSTQMPRWASRITLEITDVRVERLQAASDDNFKAEGYPLERELTGGSTDAFCWFRHLWDSVSKPDCNFESNPWVWVIEFKRV